MKMNTRWATSIFCLIVLLSPLGKVAAQEKVRKPRAEGGAAPERVVVTTAEQVEGRSWSFANGGPDNFIFISSEMAFDGKLVTNAPYSAEAVTESIQTLADGNRIVRKSTAQVYRDSEGRTRRDQTLGAIGPYAVAGEPPQTILINDPVAGVQYSLDPRSQTAHKMPAITFKPGELFEKTPGGYTYTVRSGMKPMTDEERKKVEELMQKSRTAALAGTSGVVLEKDGVREFDPQRESLGKQMIEGVEAEGSRTTITIAAGKIGNELPINIVSERWYSPELQTVVMTKTVDPRHGENIYRLTNINRSEPARSLFEVPAGYTIKEGGPYRFKVEASEPVVVRKKKNGNEDQ